MCIPIVATVAISKRDVVEVQKNSRICSTQRFMNSINRALTSGGGGILGGRVRVPLTLPIGRRNDMDAGIHHTCITEIFFIITFTNLNYHVTSN